MIARARATGPSSRAGSPGPGERISPSMSGASATALEIVWGRTRTRAPRRRIARTMFDLSPKSTIPISGPSSSWLPMSMIDDGETLPTKSWSSQRGTARARSTASARSTTPGSVTIARRLPWVRRWRASARVSTPAMAGMLGVAQERRELAGVLEHGGGRVGHDQRPQPRVGRLVVVDRVGRSCRSADRS